MNQVDEAAALAAVEAVSGPLHPADVALALAGPSPTTSPSAPRVCRTRWSSGATRCSRLDGEVARQARLALSSAQRWRRMRGRSGTLHTGHWLVDTRRPEVRRHQGSVGSTSSTLVHFAELTDAEIERYRRHGRTAPRRQGVHHRWPGRSLRQRRRGRPPRGCRAVPAAAACCCWPTSASPGSTWPAPPPDPARV